MKRLYIAIMCIFCFLLMSCSEGNLYTYYGPVYCFDSAVYLGIHAEDAEEYFKDIKKMLNEISSVTSDYNGNYAETSVYDLNEKRSVNKTDTLAELLTLAVDIQNETNGYFNPFIGKLSRLWKTAITSKELPSDTDIEKEVQNAQNTSVTITDEKIILNGSGNLDLGAITKGYALDKIKAYMDEKNCKYYYADLGVSSLYAGNPGVRVYISKPYSDGAFMNISLVDNGIATSSGQNQNFYFNGKRYHHLVNPKTGYPETNYDSVSVLSKDNARNDAYATALFSMPMDEINKLKNEKGFDYIIYANNKITATGEYNEKNS